MSSSAHTLQGLYRALLELISFRSSNVEYDQDRTASSTSNHDDLPVGSTPTGRRMRLLDSKIASFFPISKLSDHGDKIQNYIFVPLKQREEPYHSLQCFQKTRLREHVPSLPRKLSPCAYQRVITALWMMFTCLSTSYPLIKGTVLK